MVNSVLRIFPALALLLGLAAAPPAAAQARGDLLIRNATVLTVTSGTLENTDILIRNGRIERLGSGLTAPRGVEVIDATGMYALPGIIDAHSHIALSSVNEATSPVTAQVTMKDVINPYDIGIYRALAGGVTVANLMHGSANVIGGQNATIKLRFGETTPRSLLMEGAPQTIKFALGENPTRVHGRGNNIVPASRMGVETVLRNTLNEAIRYRDAWDHYERERRRNPNLVSPPYDDRLEVISRILSGEILVHAHSYRADEILMLLNVVRDFGIENITFQHANEAFMVAPELAAYGAHASVFSDWWAYKFEVYYSTAYNATILARNGVVTSLNSDSPSVIRHLYHEAGKTQKYGGLSDEEALALITINPAIQLGIADRVGSIEPGKDADIVLFNAHPLSIYAVPQRTIVDGIVRFHIEADTDDQRLMVSPDDPIPAAMLWEEHHDERCLQGVDLMDLLLDVR